MRRKHGLRSDAEVEFVRPTRRGLDYQGGYNFTRQARPSNIASRRQNQGPDTRMAAIDARMILVDTSVIADIFTKDPDWFEWSSGQIERAASLGPVAYDAIVFAELSVKFDTQKDLENRLSAFL